MGAPATNDAHRAARSRVIWMGLSPSEKAVAFVRASKDKPFFLYFPHPPVHNPLRPGERFKGRSGNGALADRVEEVDWSVGQVLDAVRELKLGERAASPKPLLLAGGEKVRARNLRENP